MSADPNGVVSQQAANVIPPFLQQPPQKKKTPNYVNVNPIILIFDPASSDSSSKLQIQNTSVCRLAFRVLLSAPTRYVVTPCSGFLTQGETKMISIRLVDPSKYSARHRFIVQAKPALESDNNRKGVWKVPCHIDLLHNVRVKTMKQLSSGASSSSSSLASNGSSSASSLSPDSPASPVNRNPSEVSVTEVNDPVVKDQIDRTTENVKKSIESKEKAANRMVDLINEVKMQEVELDRLSSQLLEVDGKVGAILAENVHLRAQGMIVAEELNAYKMAQQRDERK